MRPLVLLLLTAAVVAAELQPISPGLLPSAVPGLPTPIGLWLTIPVVSITADGSAVISQRLIRGDAIVALSDQADPEQVAMGNGRCFRILLIDGSHCPAGVIMPLGSSHDAIQRAIATHHIPDLLTLMMVLNSRR